MSRPLRISFPGAFYHVMARGNGRALIYLDDGDRQRFLELLGDVHEQFELVCHTFCLMENHYHLVVETPGANLSAAIKHLNGVYAQWWNNAHKRCGHVFQGRFKAQLVQQDRYLRAVCRYVVRNPLRAGLVTHPRDWPWSSYRASVGLEEPPRFLSTALLRSLVSSRTDANTGAAFERFVLQADDLDLGEAIRRDARVLGTDSFWRAAMSTCALARNRELPKRDFARLAPPLASLIDRETRLTRDRGIWIARHEHGYGVTEIARHLGLHSETVQTILRRARAGQAGERKTRFLTAGSRDRETDAPAETDTGF